MKEACLKGLIPPNNVLEKAHGERLVVFMKRVKRSVQFSSVQSLSRVQLFVTPQIAARQASLSITNSQSSLRLMSIESVMPSSHLILCRPLLLLPLIPPSIRVFSMTWGVRPHLTLIILRNSIFKYTLLSKAVDLLHRSHPVQNDPLSQPHQIRANLGTILPQLDQSEFLPCDWELRSTEISGESSSCGWTGSSYIQKLW